MIKRMSLVTLILSALAAAVGIVGNGRSGQVGAEMNVKDLAQIRVYLTSPSDPSYNALLDKLMKGRLDSRVEALKQYSVLVRNLGNKNIVGYSLTWRFTGPGGHPARQTKQYAQVGALLDGQQPKSKPGAWGEIVIRPQAHRFVSLMADFGEDSQVVGELDPSSATRLEQLTADLAQGSDLSVTLDAVVFEDGSCAGPDEFNFLAGFKAGFQGEQDFFREVTSAADSGQSEDQVILRVKEIVDSLRTSASHARLSQYDFSRKMRAEEFLGVADKSGFAAALNLARIETYTQRPEFRKITE